MKDMTNCLNNFRAFVKMVIDSCGNNLLIHLKSLLNIGNLYVKNNLNRVTFLHPTAYSIVYCN